jgi:PAS domain S-box-containing protein
MIDRNEPDSKAGDRKKVIMLVEDEKIIAMDEAMTLQKYGFDVVTAHNGKKAIDTVNQQRIDLILMDIDLGTSRMDGTQTAETILKDHEIPIVFLTNHSEKRMVDKVKGITRYGYILKNSGEFVLIESINMAFELFEAHQKTKASEERFRTVYEQAAVGIAQVRPDGSFIELNQKFCDIVGYSKEEMLQLNFKDITHPDDLHLDLENVKQVMDGVKDSFTIKKRYIHKDGRILWINLYSNIVRDKHGNPKYAIAVINDITRQKQAEQALKASEERFRTVYEQAAIGLSQVYPSGDFIDANQKFCDIVDYSKEELLKMNFKDITHPDDLNSEMEIIKKIANNELDTYNIEKRFIRKNGDVVWINLFSTVVRYKDGNPKYAIAVINDITVRKQAEEALKESEEQLRALFETARDSIFIKDKDLKYIKVNPAMENLFNMKAHDIINKTDIDLFGEEGGEHVIEMDKQVLKGETIEEFPSKPVNGVLHTFHTIKVPLREPQGNIIGICGIARDITELKQAEQALKESEEKFQQIADNINEVIYVYDPAKDKFLYINKAYEQIWEQAIQDVYDDSSAFTYSIHPDDKRAFDEAVRMEHEEGVFLNLKYRIICPDGKVKWIWSRNFPVNNEQSEHYRTVGVVRDITTQKKLEDKLKESEEKYRLLAENSTDLITMFKNYRIVYISPAIEKILGYTQDEFLNLNHLDLIHPEDKPYIIKMMNKRIKTKTTEPITYIYRQKHKDGYYRWLETMISKKIMEDYIFTILNTRDITDRKELENKLMENNERFRYILKYDPNAIAVYDKDLHYIIASDRYLDDYGVKDKDIVGKPHYEVLPEIPERWREIHRRVLKGEVLRNDNDFFVREDGSITYNRWECRPWYTIDGEIGGMITYTEVTTERVKAEMALKESEDKYRSVVEDQTEVISRFKPDGTFVFVNDVYCKYFGKSEEDLVGFKWYQVAVEEDLPYIMEKVDQMTPDEPIVFIENRVYDKEGNIRWMQFINRGFYDDKGELIEIQSVGRDITERKDLEEMLKESEEKYRLLAENSTDIIAYVDRDFKPLYISPSSDYLSGYNMEDFKNGTILFDLVYPDDVERLKHKVESNIRNKVEKSVASFRAKHKDGRMRWWENSAKYMYDEKGDFIGIVLNLRDITERIKVDEKIVERELKYRTLFNVATEAIYLISEDGDILEANLTACKMLGRTRRELLNLDIDYIDPNYPRDVLIEFWKDKPDNEVFTFETQHMRKDGTLIPVMLNTVAFRLKGKRYLYGAATDITEKKEAEEKLYSSEKEKEAILNSITEIVAFYENSSLEIKWLNEGAAASVNKTVEEAIGMHCYEMWHQRGTPCEGCPVIKAFDTGEKQEEEVMTPDGTIWLIHANPIKDGEKVMGVVESGQNITKHRHNKQRLEHIIEEKDFLMKELNHRVKNNLMMIVSLINLKNMELSEEIDLSDIRHQIDAIRLVHEKLYQDNVISGISIHDYIQSLLNTVFTSFTAKPIEIDIDVEDITLSTKTTVPLGLVINEIATNAIKYGFSEGDKAKFTIKLSRDKESNQFILIMSNTGGSFPEEIGLDNPKTLGLRLISALVEQLDGTIELEKEPYPVFTIKFPIPGD